MKQIVSLALVVGLVACSNASSDENATNNQGVDAGQDAAEQLVFDTNLPLPSVSGDASCEEVPDFTGGDLRYAMDRIVVGTVTSIDVAPFQNGEFVCPTAAQLTLVVKMDVEENLLGEGDMVEFFLNPNRTLDSWSSRPRYRTADGTWVGSGRNSQNPPPVRVSENLGWTDKFGIYPGQRLVVMLYDEGGLNPGSFPLGVAKADGTVVFQEMTEDFLCINLPEAFSGTSTIDAIRDELAKPANEERDRVGKGQTITKSWCVEPSTPAPEFNDAGTD
jgi:hypothetical protein